ncbi:hypothetical protein ABIA03_004333 [Bradyrhizobium yuanmingense]|uniref:Uncharacterized protein n=1 Tax=Bradyrhizobium yuanmingense TaxID=108015 RepID=A0ABV4GE61_9BRAD
MTDTASIPPRLTPCKINPSNFCGRTRRRRRQNNSMPSSAVSTTSTRRVVAVQGANAARGRARLPGRERRATVRPWLRRGFPVALGRGGRDRRRSTDKSLAERRRPFRCRYRYRECGGELVRRGPSGQGQQPDRLTRSIRQHLAAAPFFSGRRFEPVPAKVAPRPESDSGHTCPGALLLGIEPGRAPEHRRIG